MTRRSLLQQAAALAALARPAHAAPASLRSRESFDFNWRFLRDDAPGAQASAFNDSGWRTVDLPHDWSIDGPFDEKAPSSGTGGYLPTGIGWYRKRFRLPEGSRGRLFTIEFDGVYENSDVWINGHHLGKRPYGYIPFAYDLTPHLDFAGENILAVRADNSHQTNCRWYSGSGIYRHTWLLSTAPLHVGYWGTFVTTPQVGRDAATVQIKTTVRNDGKAAARCTLASAVLDRNGASVATAEAVHEIAAGGEYEFVQQVRVDKPNLWSPDTPYLYKVRSTIQGSDEYETPLGIREAQFDADKGFVLNGERVKLNGVCVHHDAGCLGAAIPEAVWERRFRILREMGCNAIRTSHNPFAAEFLELCDRMGFLVMNEAFDEWRVPKGQIGRNGYAGHFDEWHERDVTAFVRRDRNHPSVVLWSAGNEIGDQSDPRGAETLRSLLDIFHREDPTRLVTAGCDRIASEPPTNTARPEFLAQLDVVGYNYADRWRDRIEKYYSIDRAAFPRRRMIGTESGSMGGVRGDYRSLFPADMPAGPFRGFGRGRNIDVEQLWKFVRVNDYVAGDFMWTGIDHLGEARWPAKGSSSGVIDTCGFRKDGYYFYQSQWTTKPVLYVFPHWNWKGKEGQFVPVTAYTNCDTVELFVNGRSAGVKGYAFPRLGMEGTYGNYPARARVSRTTADLHLSWDISYEPGTLKAVGTKDGKVVTTIEIASTGDPAAILLTADRDRIRADRRDVVHLTARIVDAQGRPVPTADNEITLEVSGEVRLLGMDAGNLASHEDYHANRRKAFNGLCLAILQSTAKAGQVRVSATAAGLKSAEARIATG